MAVFAILAEAAKPDLQARLEGLYPTDMYAIDDRSWLISTESVADAVRDQIGITGGSYGRVLVIRIADIAGWHNKALWAWAEPKIGSA